MKNKTHVCVAVMWFFLAVEAQAMPRVALVLQGDPDPATIALCEARLSESGKFQLVERREIDKILEERKIVAFNAEDAVGLGSILGVTQFAVLQPEGLVVFDTKYGLRIVDAPLPKDPEKAAAGINGLVESSLDFKLQDADLYGILELRNAELGSARDAWCFALGNMFERSLLNTGAVVVERSRLEHLNRERLLPTDAAGSELLTMTKFVNLEFKRGKDAATFVLEATVGDKTVRAVASFQSPGEAVDKIATELTAGRSEAVSTRPDRKAEAARFYREGDRLHFGGYLPRALECYEAAHALTPENVGYLRRLCDQLGYIAESTMFPERKRARDTVTTWENVSRSMNLARRILDLIEYSNLNDGKTRWFLFSWTNYMNCVNAVPADIHPDWAEEQRRFWARVIRVQTEIEYPEACRTVRDFNSLQHFVQVINHNIEFNRYAPMETWFEQIDRRIRDLVRFRKQFPCQKSTNENACSKDFCPVCRIPYDWMRFIDFAGVVLSMPQQGTVLKTSEKIREMLRFMTEEGNRYDANVAWLIERESVFRKEAGLAYATPEQYARHTESQSFNPFGSLVYVGDSKVDVKSSEYEKALWSFAADVRNRIRSRLEDGKGDLSVLVGTLRTVYERYCTTHSFERDFWINFYGVSLEDILSVASPKDLRKIESAWKAKTNEIEQKTPAAAKPWVSEKVLWAAGKRERGCFKRIRINGNNLCAVKHVESKDGNTIRPFLFNLKTLEQTPYPEIEIGEIEEPPFRNEGFDGISLDVDDENIYLGVFGHGVWIYPLRGGEPTKIDETAGLPSNLVQGLGGFRDKLYVGLGNYRATGYLVTVDLKTHEIEILSSSVAKTGIAPFYNRKDPPEFHGFYRDEKRNRLLFNAYESVFHEKTINGIWAFDPETNSFTRITRCWAQGEVLPLPGGDALLVQERTAFYLLDLNDDSCRPICSTMDKEDYVRLPEGFDFEKSVHRVLVRNCTVIDGWIWALAEKKLNQFGPRHWIRLKLYEPGRTELLQLPDGVDERNWMHLFYDILATPDGKGLVVAAPYHLVFLRFEK